ncbi:PREDICTED: UBAP1-MVB12-associated (UMA)-domain containing protein 1 [Thamnophis sirtalis]|uniref:UBAP1-MVB12-associated (UMA)-domain containing protein 1 n=1 Tax=Thamnophis sirtalis TaxID=35019 RepID=A0A6I9X3V3_9SAUR|nr:PREDICTED: UBAP1-MVB12-associated (UMA)-domain containing protein 1 [Thamnophis sirtalis]XP_013909977.1 PREDICTED: UBAP1-MVB12-associated (UMA)-domain containing protein 1 [Thamnophis sirtalis]XP_013909978.1 PREDICTED: UBAP1-MVB12-associated (UMA)-domain containing protein 1 [Thamnophis sirtalis]XP_013909979.1 PREDICTED: UBAP1-MVB12-associated (UMA)-domain containing protein 1 [Thamnophis sirtalis]XP_032092918.1 UBAP1-MVB12-associated (UMA)-domain containing protein 1 [Thamnophis elegans]XP
MFSLFRKSQDTKKVAVTDKEVDGFVFLGNTINEERKNSENKPPLCVTGPQFDPTSQANSENQSKLTEADIEPEAKKSQNMESSSVLEFPSDVPFALAPHILAVQDTCNDFSRQLISCDVNDNLARFWYDFTLENSVLCES